MKPIALALLLALSAAPIAAQAIPAEIPDLPGESPADRARDRLEERYRGTISRFFAAGGLDVAPVTEDGPAYQANLAVGLTQQSGDALLVTLSVRQSPPIPGSEVPGIQEYESAVYFGAGYEIRAARFLGRSPLADRGSLRLGVGVLRGEVSAIAFQLTPAYDLVTGNDWALPIGLTLSYAVLADDDTTVARPFLGVGIGLKHYFGHRDRLE
jgi:hypothetical protein